MITPLDKSIFISEALGINLYIKRDDLYPKGYGGSKSRKLDFIFSKYINQGYNSLVTTGSLHSNHVRSSAVFGANEGWKSIIIIHDTRPTKLGGNLLITSLTGAELRFVDKKDVKESMDNATKELQCTGYKPLYIWGGGHTVEGTHALYNAVIELKKQLNIVLPDFIVVASGTGSTQAGLELGARKFFSNCKVIGVSVARKEERGKREVYKSMIELNEYLGKPLIISDDIKFDDRWIGSGYSSTYSELIETIKWAAKLEGLLLDPIYTGKAFTALKNYVKEGVIPKGSNVVFWHTGGIINLLDSKFF